MKNYDAVIIGGGAAGLAAAVMCVREGLSAAILEAQPRVGKKLLATGSGTCNLSNSSIQPKNYHSLKGDGADFTAPVLRTFTYEAAVGFFESIGVETETDSRGRAYPVCRSSAAVLDSLRMAYLNSAEEITGFEAVDIKKTADGFTVTSAEGREIKGKNVIVAVGGAASPSLGGKFKSYKILDSFGVKATKQLPSVTGIRCDTAFIRAVKGLRATVELKIILNGRLVDSATEELLFTENGLSGPAAYFTARSVSLWEADKSGKMTAEISFLPKSNARELIYKRRRLNRPADELLTGLFQKRIGQTLLRCSGVPLANRSCDSLNDSELNKILQAVTCFRAEITGTTGMKDAQATAGGIELNEVNKYTMELVKQPHIYCVGEALDIDGDCGGYNLHFAFGSAFAAVKSIKGG